MTQEVTLRDILNQIDARFVHLGERMGSIENRMGGLENRMNLLEDRMINMEARLNARLADLDARKADKWEFRIWFMTVLTILGAVLGTLITKL